MILNSNINVNNNENSECVNIPTSNSVVPYLSSTVNISYVTASNLGVASGSQSTQLVASRVNVDRRGRSDSRSKKINNTSVLSVVTHGYNLRHRSRKYNVEVEDTKSG